MEALFGDVLVDKAGVATPVASLAQLDGVLIYFSAHWCPPCRGFTPQLAKWYTSGLAAGKKFEIVFVSSDKSDAEFNQYMAEMPWKALPFADRKRKADLSRKFKVEGIPTLVVVDAQTGKLITSNGREQVAGDPTAKGFPWRPRPLKEVLGNKFVNATGQSFGADALAGKVVGLYFSAHWCGPCRQFTPQLIKTYTTLKQQGKNFEIVFCSSDRDQAAFDGYFKEMPWLGLPFVDRNAKEALSALFQVRGIPTLVLIDYDTQRVITTQGRAELGSDPQGQRFPWVPPVVSNLNSPDANKLNQSAGLIVFAEEGGEEKAIAALEAIATEMKAAAEAKDEDPDLLFFYAVGNEGLVPRIRGMMMMPDRALGIFDAAQECSFHADVFQPADVTEASVRQFVHAYQAGAVPAVPLNA